MAITTIDLGNGKWQVTDTTKQVAYVTTMDQNAETLRQNESELTRANTRADDYEANKDYYTTAAAGITGATIPPIADTNPVQYLLEWPPGNPYTSTEAQNNQRLSTATANEDYMRVTEIPNIQTEIDNGNEIMDNIQSEPVGGSNQTFDFLPAPQNIPQGAEPTLEVPAASTLQGEVQYVEVTIAVTHPAPPSEMLRVGLISPDGTSRELAYQDFPGTSTWATSYFNGLEAGGEWKLTLWNDATATTNTFDSGSIKIFIP